MNCTRCKKAPAGAGFKTCDSCREYQRLRSARRWTDPQYRAWKIAAESARRVTDEQWRQKKNAYARARSRARRLDPVTAEFERARVRASLTRLRAVPEWKAKWAAYWRSDHGRLVRRTLNHRRAARLKSVPSSGSAVQRAAILAAAGGICPYCGEAAPLTLDHYYPIHLGGQDTLANLIPACKSCNSKKWALRPQEWLLRCDPSAVARLARLVA